MWRSKSKAVLILGQKGLSGTRVLQHNKHYARIIHTSSLPNSNDFLTPWRWRQQQQQRLFNESSTQRRRFLGCGDGEEGSVLSKVYEERLVLGYSPEQLFDVVAAVDLYHGFVPWCQRSEVIKHNPDGSFDAELEIGFKFLVESYISHVELNRPKYIKTTVTDSNLFDHLINIWEFNPGSVPGTCNLYFLVDFKFQSPLYRHVASVFFKEVVSRLVGSFNERCRLIYGPGVRVLENSYGQRV
ncbi:hypothetical protein SO802_034666 [Lithocarpus litseifolius]|uniref:Coenzyme Q-binding protein COQ10 START domain-containing protein n=1 Tax=Lithocarpus litseifolius TaxID=425828 RepID=A0AAW2BGJ6_9ROSI